MSKRLAGRCGYPADDPFRVTLHPERLDEPLKWKKPRRVFVCSMGDLFHEDVPRWMRFEVMDIILQAKQHTFLILTKRPANMKEFFEWYYSKAGRTIETIKNLWLGVTAENQARADERIPILLQIPAAVRFVSIEPMLGPVNLNFIGIDWVICGGESGSVARPMHPDWVRSLRDQCQYSGVPFFFKLWGTWKPVEQVEHGLLPDDEHRSRSHMVIDQKGEDWTGAGGYKFAQPGWHFERTGKKKKAGRLLDGEIWDEMPEI